MDNQLKTPRRSDRLQRRGTLTESTTKNTFDILNKSMKTPSDLFILASPLSVTKTTRRATRYFEKPIVNTSFASKITTPKATRKEEKAFDDNTASPSFMSTQLVSNEKIAKIKQVNCDEELLSTSLLTPKQLTRSKIPKIEINKSPGINKVITPIANLKILNNINKIETPIIPCNVADVSPVTKIIAPETTDEQHKEDNDLNITFSLLNEDIKEESNKTEKESYDVKLDNLTIINDPSFSLEKKENVLTGKSDNVTLRNDRIKRNNSKFSSRRNPMMMPLKKVIQTPEIFKRNSSKKQGNESNVLKNINHIRGDLSVAQLINECGNQSIIKSIRKRSLSVTDTDTIKKNNRVKFYSPLNSEIQIDVIDKKMKFNSSVNNSSKNISGEQYSAKKRERTQSNIEVKSDFNGNLKFAFSPSIGKLPNFAAIHNKEFNKMESIVEHSQRKNERAKTLFAKNASENQSSSLNVSKIPLSVKALKTVQSNKYNANKVVKRNQKNVKLFKNRPNIEECIKTQIKEKQSDMLRLVRTNRRFDLLMEFRKLKE